MFKVGARTEEGIEIFKDGEDDIVFESIDDALEFADENASLLFDSDEDEGTDEEEEEDEDDDFEDFEEIVILAECEICGDYDEIEDIEDFLDSDGEGFICNMCRITGRQAK